MTHKYECGGCGEKHSDEDHVCKLEAASPPCYRDLVSELHSVATGRTAHIYSGLCPDGVEGPDVRDEHCPACRVLIEADKVLSR